MLIIDNLGTEDAEKVYRGCINTAGLGDYCENVDIHGIQGTVCVCTTDNCNKDLPCDCPSTGL